MPALGPPSQAPAPSPPAVSEQERALRLSMAQDRGRVFGQIVTVRIAPFLLLVFIYGVINLVTMGKAREHYCQTYVPLVGAVASILSCVLYSMAMVFGRSWLAVLMVITGFIPYVFALFVMVVFGG